MNQLSFLARLEAHDREVFHRWVAVDCSDVTRRFWRTITHLGGGTFTIVVALTTIIFGDGLLREAGIQAAVTLAATHAVAQALKRTITRPRPAGGSFEALIGAPDRFSFPSGHAIAATSLALVYASQFPRLAPPLLLVATLVAVSRVRLGVHFPGDVLAGQIIAFLGTMAVLLLL